MIEGMGQVLSGEAFASVRAILISTNVSLEAVQATKLKSGG